MALINSAFTPEALAGNTPHALRDVVRVRGPQASATHDDIACEQAVALEYNGISHAALMASPEHVEELALGFSFTEGIIESPADVLDLDVETTALGLIAHLRITNARLHALKLRRRSLMGRTSCGLCGVESLGEVPRALAALAAPASPWTRAAIDHALGQLRQCQPLHNLTGATHAAAWATAQGGIAFTYEDVGRHNALDKLVGRLLCEPIDRAQGFIVVSSRASFEMVQKTHAAGVRALVAVSAPTTLAIELAHSAGILLAGFAREDRFTVYAHPEHLDLSASQAPPQQA